MDGTESLNGYNSPMTREGQEGVEDCATKQLNAGRLPVSNSPPSITGTQSVIIDREVSNDILAGCSESNACANIKTKSGSNSPGRQRTESNSSLKSKRTNALLESLAA